MRIFGFLLLCVNCCLFLNNSLFAQKRLLDHSSADVWPVIVSSKISNDGKYFAYKIKSEKAGTKLIVQNRTAKWKMEITDIGNNFQFTEDSKWLTYSLPNDSIGLLELGKANFKYVDQSRYYEVPANGNGRWMACLLKDAQHDLLLLDLQQGTEVKYPGVREFKFNPNGDVLLFQTIATKDAAGKFYWFDLANKQMTCIGSGYRALNMAFDKTGSKLAYLSTVQTNGQNIISLHYYKIGTDSASLLLMDNHILALDGIRISTSLPVRFSKLGDKLFFGVNPIAAASKVNEKVQIKHYQDDIFTSEKNSGPLLTVIDLKYPHRVVRLQQNSDAPYRFHLGGGEDDDYVSVESKIIGNREESRWNVNARPSISLVSTKNGSRRLIKRHLACYDNINFSTTGKYLVWYDRVLKQWFSYDVASSLTNNITHNIKVSFDQEDDRPHLTAPEGIAGWMANDQSVLIYDRYDLWQVDPAGKQMPINITHFYGITNNTRFRLLSFSLKKGPEIGQGDTLLLTALDLKTKDNGFFKLPLTAGGKLLKLTMEPKAYYIPFRANVTLNLGSKLDVAVEPPQKAKHADIYLLASMSSTEYPNLNITSDFIHFRPITDLSPQRNYNWYTSELIHWKLFDGNKAEGVLYKPENFDPKKKYPIIFYYYEKSADALNCFLAPELSMGQINIPWFVSNGYLVFVPDIYYKTGHPGQSAYNSVVSSAKMLAKKTWVNAHKMGLQGHSFGGFETNYIVTRSHLFAAAAPAAGVSNFTSGYGDDNRQLWYETGQPRMAASLWKKSNLYISNSPVFGADKVTTPLFIMHNKDDGSVPWSQEEEWYSDLAWLGKKTWMASYSGEGHSIDDPVNQLDYSIRLGQFFDYYLKGAPPPKWMTEGSNSIELDYSGKKP
ncbi:MAG TPA: prolyl oligopeptidase family serine peptidase [Mucilaginibacter sp.]|nr:prolyl oligopeptidase family serine peptidase [Mucilaginibacter sp.]